MDEYGAALVDGVEKALPLWVERSVERILVAWRGSMTPDERVAAETAGREAAEEILPRLRSLLAAPIDEQRQTPLSVLRQAVRFPTGVLRDSGVPEVERDAFAARMSPDDVYDLTPASFADISPDLVEVGLAWGAAKAMAHRRKHRS